MSDISTEIDKVSPSITHCGMSAESQNVKPAETPVPKDPFCKQVRWLRQCISKRHVTAATLTHATEELWVAAFSVRPVQKLHPENRGTTKIH
jgi:hypothetical protein